MKRKYHYEYAAYTDNLCYGRVFIAQARSKTYVVFRAQLADKGAYVIEKVRVYE